MGLALIPVNVREKFEVAETHHASSILQSDFPAEWADIVEMLAQFRLKQSQIIQPGKNRSEVAIGIDGFFFERGWAKHTFQIEVLADGARKLAPTHEVDNFRNRVAVETEWNNKDPFYDRDLTTFRLLFELNVLSVGVIVTRAKELQDIFVDLGRGSSYGNSTTHMDKLVPRLENRASGGCPVLAFGIKKAAYDPQA
jgi:hypothetical protein